MSKNPLLHRAVRLPVFSKLEIQSKQFLKKLRSFDVLEWNNTPYGSHLAQKMHIFELNDLAPRDGWPTVLMIHGGGWVSGTPESLQHIAPRFSRKGIMACTVQYRLAPQVTWPAPLNDIHAALDFLRAQQVDLNRIALWGVSAGAQLALRAAQTYPHPIAAVVALAPAVDLTQLDLEHTEDCFPSQQHCRDASPAFDHGMLPPTLIIHGSLDPIFPFAHTQEFARRPGVTLWPLEGGNHGLHLPFRKARQLKHKAIEWLVEQMDLPARGSKWKRRKKKNR